MDLTLCYERGALWNDVRGKYGECEGGWSTEEVRGVTHWGFERQFGDGGPSPE